MVALLTLALLGQAWIDDSDHLPPLLRRATNTYAWHSFAPSSGVGMSALCACSALTSVDGTALGGARVGNATCSKKGFATTGIENGDLVVCSDNMPRVELLSNGMTGVHFEVIAATNSLLRSAEPTNAAWTWENSGAAATTRTADYATAPDGSMNAARFQIPATSGAQYTDVYQGFTVAASSPAVCSVYVKGASASGVTDLCGYGGGAAWSCTACSFVAGTWTRCVHSMVTDIAATSRFCKLGNNSNQNGAVARSAVDLLAWGFQGEATTTGVPTSYIPTTTAAVTRNVDQNPHFVRTVPTTAGVCVAATVEVPSLAYFVSGAGMWAPMLSALNSTASAPYFWPYTAGTGASLAIDTSGVTGAPSGYAPALDNPTTIGRYMAGHNGTHFSYCVNGVCRTNATPSVWTNPTSFAIIKMTVNASLLSNSIWSDVEVDPAFGRCRR